MVAVGVDGHAADELLVLPRNCFLVYDFFSMFVSILVIVVFVLF